MGSVGSFVLLSLIIFLPTAAALVICSIPKKSEEFIKLFSFVTTVAVFLLTVLVAIPGDGSPKSVGFVLGKAGMQHAFSVGWIESFNIYYCLGLDGSASRSSC